MPLVVPFGGTVADLITDGLASGTTPAPPGSGRLITRGLFGTAAGLMTRGLGLGARVVTGTGRDLREALFLRLTGSADLLAIVGPGGIYPAVIPIQGLLPAVTFSVPENPRLHGLTGFHLQAGAIVTFNFASWSLSDVIAAKTIVEGLLDGRNWTAGSVMVQWSEQLSEEDLHEPPVDASDRWLFRTVVRYRVKHLPAPSP